MTDADRVEFERLSIISSDLVAVARFLREYLARAFYNSQGSAGGVLGEALTVAIIVTYARPFTRSRDRFGKWESFEPSFLTADLPDQQRGLHDRIVRYERPQGVAHSDAGPQKIRVLDTPDGRLTISEEVRVLLEKWEAEGLLANVCHMQALLKPRLEQMLATVKPDKIR